MTGGAHPQPCRPPRGGLQPGLARRLLQRRSGARQAGSATAALRSGVAALAAVAPNRPNPPLPPAPMCFGAFAITETQSFPPPCEARCWAYLTLNAEITLSLPDSPALQELVRSSQTRISVDGQWLWWALRRKYPGRPLVKLSGSELIHAIAAHCAAHGQRLLLLGASVRANAGAVQRLRQHWPRLDVAGYAPPHYVAGHESERQVHASALAVVRAWRPDYVVLGLGANKEHRFAAQTLAQLDGLVSGVLCFGGAIDMASGLVQRAPPLWQQLGLEGLFRVLQQPARLRRLLRVLRVLPLLLRGQY